MNWDAIGAVGEVLGALAVVVSLVYLATQVRQNKAQIELQALMDAIERHVTKYVEATETDEKAENFRNGLTDFLSMPINERAKFHSTMTGLVGGFIQVWRLYHAGTLVSEDYKAMEGSFIGLFRCPGAQQWLEPMKPYFTADVVAFIEKAISDPSIPSAPSIEDLPALNENL